jgi:hypothetical protein
MLSSAFFNLCFRACSEISNELEIEAFEYYTFEEIGDFDDDNCLVFIPVYFVEKVGKLLPEREKIFF